MKLDHGALLGEAIGPSASYDQAHLKHRSSSDVGAKSLRPQTPLKNRIILKSLFREFEKLTPGIPSIDQLLVWLGRDFDECPLFRRSWVKRTSNEPIVGTTAASRVHCSVGRGRDFDE